ncbi:MAG: metal-dependent hydrolase, partial [Cryobacterium sp.]
SRRYDALPLVPAALRADARPAGYAMHLVGDLLTTRGLPLFWPIMPRPPRNWARVPLLEAVWTSGGYVAVPVLGNAGSVREWLLLIPVTAYVGYGVLYAVLEEAGADLVRLGG